MSFKDLIPWRRNELTQREYDNPFLSLQREVNSLFDDFFKGFDVALPGSFAKKFGALTPTIDVVENEKEVKITAELPGVEEKDIDLAYSDGVLTLKGEKREEKKEEGENGYHVERSFGSFTRQIQIPTEVEADKIDAGFKNGVLTVRFPKSATAKDKIKKIKISKG